MSKDALTGSSVYDAYIQFVVVSSCGLKPWVCINFEMSFNEWGINGESIYL